MGLGMSALGGEADVIAAKADIAPRMSAIRGKADVWRDRRFGLLLAKSGPKRPQPEPAQQLVKDIAFALPPGLGQSPRSALGVSPPQLVGLMAFQYSKLRLRMYWSWITPRQ